MDKQISGILPDQAWPVLKISGPAAGKFLQRMLSNDVNKLSDSHAAPAFLLEPTGRIIAGAWFVKRADNILALCPPGWRGALKAGLEKYRLADAVEFAEDARAAIVWLNPPAELFGATVGAVVASSQGLAIRSGDYGDQAIFWLGDAPAAPIVPEGQAELLRLTTATPAFDRELSRETIPLEAGLYNWLSNKKGCYVGQEVVERMWSRDRIARRLTRFTAESGTLPGQLPLPVVGAAGKGQITSAIATAAGQLLGLGYYSAAASESVQAANGQQWQAEPVEVQAKV